METEGLYRSRTNGRNSQEEEEEATERPEMSRMHTLLHGVYPVCRRRVDVAITKRITIHIALGEVLQRYDY